eukprot:TRINITY_DN82114_c0_g1_i2.p1 TRINITY_DN82114_c0_g1~~TRINITY_DN82114_c0_g1_i2.p1  ORF type:complete len:265 (+),score=16.88 TRINITY_DN82114_c0_g1_i2:101-895(+)
MDSFQGEFNRAKQDIFRFVTDVNKFGQQVNKLETARDTVDFRKKLTILQVDLTDRARKIGSGLADLKSYSKSVSSFERHEVDKLISETQDQLQRFQQIQEECKRIMEKNLPKSDKPSGSGSMGVLHKGRASPQLTSVQFQQHLDAPHQQEQIQDDFDPILENQIMYHEQLIEERDQGIQEINTQIVEVNEIFQDLAVLVVDQGETVEHIDYNISNVANNVEEGRKQLKGAENHQKGATKRLWCLFVIVVIILVVIIVALLTTHF